MAVIGKIRERGSLLVIIVGGALVLFIVGELISGSSGLSRGDQSVGEVAGQEIGLQEFGRRVDEIADRARQRGTTVDNQLQEQIRGQVWNELVREKTLKVEAEKAGLGSTISLEELDDIRFGNNIAPMFRNDQSVMDPATGQPSPDRLREGLRNLQERDPASFHELNVGLASDRIYQKYNTLLKKSCFVNSAQLADEYAGKNTKATFTLVGKRYDSEPDSLYAIGEEELSRYYNAHKNDRRYRQQASRSFAYVRFPATPTEGDIEAARSELAQAKAEFEAASGSKADSAFVLGFAQTKNPAATAYTEGTADHLNDSLIINAQPGTVVGPFREGNSWKLVKVTELADVPEARVRHILLNSPGEDATIKQRADSIMAVVKRDRSKFDALVTQFSEDGGSKGNGGVYEWFDKTRMVPEFTAASFDQKVGAITIAKTSFGYHIVEVLGQRNRSERRVLTVDKTIEPVQAMKDAWKTANEYSLTHKDTADFRTSAEGHGLAYTPVAELRGDQRFVPGLQKPEEVMAWVNHAAPDATTSEPLATDDGYVVCILRGIREAGVPKLQDVRELFTREARKEKKGDALVAKMDAATDLNALATELGVQVQNGTDLTFSANSLPGGFSDPKAIGSVFGVANGQTRSFKGDMGAYKVTMGTLTPAGEMPAGSEDLKVATDKVRNRAEGQAFNAMKENAEVKDDRSRFF